MSKDSKKEIISMLVADDKLSLFLVTGSILEIKNDENYDVEGIIEFLTENLTGTNTVELNLEEYSTYTPALLVDEEDTFEKEGQITVQMIGGKEVEGIFFARKPQIVVQVGDEKVLIPDVDNLRAQIARSREENSPGVKAFLRRVAPLMKKRSHSAKDLMGFIKGSELPLTNDGRVIVYKKVRSTSKPGVFVDCHSKTVEQQVGSRVIMPIEQVDPSRHSDCSTGLHVANLAYMNGFSGDTILMILVKPENFIAVPKYDKSKARVCEYDIIGTLNNRSFELVSSSLQLDGDISAEQLIQKAIIGDIPAPFEEVHVLGPKKVEIRAYSGEASTQAEVKGKARPSGKPLKKYPEEETKETSRSSRLVKSAKKLKNKLTGKVSKLSIPEQAAKLYGEYDSGDLNALTELLAFKKAKKKSWKALGFSAARIKRIETASTEPTVDTPVKKTPKPKTSKKSVAQAPNTGKPLGIKDQAQFYYRAWLKGDRGSFDTLVRFKKSKKKSWAALGLSKTAISKIEKALK